MDPGFLHSTILSNLTPGETVFYDFGYGNDTSTRSPVFSFVAPRATDRDDDEDNDVGDDDEASFTFLLTSDMGIGGITPAMKLKTAA